MIVGQKPLEYAGIKAMRPGIDLHIDDSDVSYDFDHGRLWACRFYRRHGDWTPDFMVYEDGWRNLPPIEGLRVSLGMSWDDLKLYIGKWVQQNHLAGVVRAHDLREMQTKPKSFLWAVRGKAEDKTRSIELDMGPVRIDQIGASSDSWTFGFDTNPDSSDFGKLTMILAICDRYTSRTFPRTTQ